MVRLLLILLSMAAMITAFQNCAGGGSLTLEKSRLSNFSSSGLTQLLGSCNNMAAGRVCDERWSATAADIPAVQTACGSAYQAGPCASAQDLIGVCETVANKQLQRLYYYQGYSQNLPPADEFALVKSQCKGTWH